MIPVSKDLIDFIAPSSLSHIAWSMAGNFYAGEVSMSGGG